MNNQIFAIQYIQKQFLKFAENIGLAVFKGDKLVGELTAMETVCFSLMRNNVNGFLITIPDPMDDESYIDLYLFPAKDTKGNDYLL